MVRLTVSEYNRLRDLINTVKDKRNSNGIRRLAMAEYRFVIRNREQLKQRH